MAMNIWTIEWNIFPFALRQEHTKGTVYKFSKAGVRHTHIWHLVTSYSLMVSFSWHEKLLAKAHTHAITRQTSKKNMWLRCMQGVKLKIYPQPIAITNVLFPFAMPLFLLFIELQHRKSSNRGIKNHFHSSNCVV